MTSDTSASVDGGGVSAEAGHTSPVARYLDRGTARMAPQPIVEPAVADMLEPFERAIGDLHERQW